MMIESDGGMSIGMRVYTEDYGAQFILLCRVDGKARSRRRTILRTVTKGRNSYQVTSAEDLAKEAASPGGRRFNDEAHVAGTIPGQSAGERRQIPTLHV